MIDGTLLLVEDDQVFAETLKNSLERRGYTVRHANGYDSLVPLLQKCRPRYAVVDLKLIGRSGLDCVKEIHDQHPDVRIVVLTGFASISTAVEAIKLGACHYLPKPANADDIESAFERAAGDTSVPVEGGPTSLKNLEWERIHQTLVETEFNISETARRLQMHRRTLARKLAKRPIK